MLGIRKLLPSSISGTTPTDGLFVDATTFGSNSAIYTPGDPTRIVSGNQSYYPLLQDGGLSFWVKLSLNIDSSNTWKFAIQTDSRDHSSQPPVGHFELTIIGHPTNGVDDNLQLNIYNIGAAGENEHQVTHFWRVSNWQEGWNHVAFQYLGRPVEIRTNEMRAWVNGVVSSGIVITNTGRQPGYDNASKVFNTYGNQTDYGIAQSIYFNYNSNSTYAGFGFDNYPNAQKSCFQQFFFVGGFGTSNRFDIDEVQRNGHFVNLGQNGTNGVTKTLVPEIYEMFQYPFTNLREPAGSLALTYSSLNDYNCNNASV